MLVQENVEDGASKVARAEQRSPINFARSLNLMMDIAQMSCKVVEVC